MSKLEQLIAKYQQPGARPISFKHLEDLLRQARFDGPVTYHYRGGIPRSIEAGKPTILDLAQDLLDKVG